MAFAPMSEQRRTIVLLQRKKVTAQREAYKLTLKTLELLDGASADEVAACKSAAATVRICHGAIMRLPLLAQQEGHFAQSACCDGEQRRVILRELFWD